MFRSSCPKVFWETFARWSVFLHRHMLLIPIRPSGVTSASATGQAADPTVSGGNRQTVFPRRGRSSPVCVLSNRRPLMCYSDASDGVRRRCSIKSMFASAARWLPFYVGRILRTALGDFVARSQNLRQSRRSGGETCADGYFPFAHTRTSLEPLPPSTLGLGSRDPASQSRPPTRHAHSRVTAADHDEVIGPFGSPVRGQPSLVATPWLKERHRHPRAGASTSLRQVMQSQRR